MSELIAEARVLVTPDTTQFRPLLVSQLAAATRGLNVPVAVTPVVSPGAASSQAAQVAGANAAAQSAAKITASASSAAAAQAQLARAADLVAVAERRAAAATGEVSIAQIRYRASIAATEATSRAYQISLKTTDALLVKQTKEAFDAASANEALALSNLQVARTEAAKTTALSKGATAQTAQLSQLSRGAGGATLSLFGLRGATLAATGPFLAGAAGATALAKSIQLATSFNSEIAVLGATTGATGVQLEQAAAAAREFGRDITLPGVTAGDAAVTITEFAKAGLDLNDSIAATRGGLQLAQAAQLSYKDAVTLTANALNAFNLSGNQAVRVADTLANASNLAQGGIEDTALALRQAAGAAAVVGVSFEDTTALLTLLAQNGLTGSDAGTALRTAFLRLVNPSKEANKVIKDLNINLRDVQGNVRPEVFAEFANAQRDLSQAQQQANAAIVFGQDAFRAFGFLGREGTEGLREVQQGLDQTGTAARIAQARMTGLAGAQENLSNQLSALGETIGQAVTPALETMVNDLADTAAGLGAVIEGVSDLNKELDGLIITPAGDAGDTFGFLKDAFVEGLELTQPAFRLVKAFQDRTEEVEQEFKNGGVELRSALEEAGREAARGAVSFEDQITTAVNEAINTINASVSAAMGNMRAQTLRSVRQAGGQAAGLEEQFDALLAGGGSLQAQIAQLQRQAQVQAKIIERAGPDAAGVLLEARRKARARLASINQRIVGIEGQIANEQKQAQDEAQRIREEAQRERDRAFLEGQEDARTRQQRRVTLADETPQLTDDIRAQQALRGLIQKQIAAIRASALDEKTKQAAIKELAAARLETTDEIRRLRKADKALRAEQRQQAADQLAENLSLRTQIAEARGDEDAILDALNAEITLAQKRVAAAKRAGKGLLQATLELEQLRQKKRDLLDAARDAADEERGLTVFDILKQNAETFLASGGNLISGNQPFAGPTGFTADVAQFLTRGQPARIEVVQKAPTTEQLQRQVNEQLARLIQALEENTAAQSGNASTVDQGTILGARANAMARFYLSRQARQLTEAESP